MLLRRQARCNATCGLAGCWYLATGDWHSQRHFPAALYSLIMFFTAAGFGGWVSYGHVALQAKGEAMN